MNLHEATCVFCRQDGNGLTIHELNAGLQVKDFAFCQLCCSHIILYCIWPLLILKYLVGDSWKLYICKSVLLSNHLDCLFFYSEKQIVFSSTLLVYRQSFWQKHTFLNDWTLFSCACLRLPLIRLFGAGHGGCRSGENLCRRAWIGRVSLQVVGDPRSMPLENDSMFSNYSLNFMSSWLSKT